MRPIYIISLLAAGLQSPLASASDAHRNRQGQGNAIQARQATATDPWAGHSKRGRDDGAAGGAQIRLVTRGTTGSKQRGRSRSPSPPPPRPPSPPPRLTARYCTLCANSYIYTLCAQGETFHRDKAYHPSPGFCDDLPSDAGTGWRPW
ncbi:uncharacterized protein PgNI_07781 [Pyricularia grisea]|uniref:Uncharacterized protein n=1 Tax=Pyricularia grisea TaxID=148305 RepID=A0A6P8B2A7_PYRGI|nr:uncharacterized protein PgNI_07781 [Pyricularia grisea]TLD08853.1 hypothetical protein PgNI_07781 [Pyricularia grisea]